MELLILKNLCVTTNDIFSQIFQIKNISTTVQKTSKPKKENSYFFFLEIKIFGSVKPCFIFINKIRFAKKNLISNSFTVLNCNLKNFSESLKFFFSWIIYFLIYFKKFLTDQLSNFIFKLVENIIVLSKLKNRFCTPVKYISSITSVVNRHNRSVKLRKYLSNFSAEGCIWFIGIRGNEKIEPSSPVKKFFLGFSLFFFLSSVWKFFFKKSNLCFFFSENLEQFILEKFRFLTTNQRSDNKKKFFKFKQQSVPSKFFLFFFLWKIEWNLELIKLIKSFQISKWVSQKKKYLKQNLDFLSNNKQKKILYSYEKWFNLPFIQKLMTLVQDFPHSLIFKVRLLCGNFIQKKIHKNFYMIRLWIKDIQNWAHFNLLSFFLLFFDIVITGLKLMKISFPTFFLLMAELFDTSDLLKIPQNLEKFLSFRFLIKINSFKKFNSFFTKKGLMDFGRKCIFKLIFYSNSKTQKILFKNWIENEVKSSFFFLITKDNESQKILNTENIFKILYRSGRWTLIYKIFFQFFQIKECSLLKKINHDINFRLYFYNFYKNPLNN